MQQGEIMNYIGGQWRPSESTEFLNIDNPATAEVLGRVPLSTRPEVDDAAEAAALAFEDWRRTPPIERIQYLFKLPDPLDGQAGRCAGNRPPRNLLPTGTVFHERVELG